MNELLPRLSLRTRLSLIYGSLFLVTGAVLLALMYFQTSSAIAKGFTVQSSGPLNNVAGEGPQGLVVTGDPTLGGNVMATRQQLSSQIDTRKGEVLHQLLQDSLIAMALLGLLAVVLGYIVAGRMMRPLKKVTRTARRLSESNLHERISLDGPKDEIRELADTFDAMLDRLDRAFDAQRRFVANASHELRTPLTINRAVLEVALASRRSPQETKVLAETLLSTTERHERLIEGLLLLAKSERELRTKVPVSLPEIVRGALDQIGDLPEQAEVDVGAELVEAVTVGDPVLLERCVANLVENAVKYNHQGGDVRITTGLMAGSPVLHVENTGPRVAAYEIETIFEPFRRLRPDRADRVGSAKGAGLGLSIVQAIVRAHGGGIEVFPRDDGGLSVTVLLKPANQLAPRLAVTAPA